MASDPPQAESLRYWLKRFSALRRQQRLIEYAGLRETTAILERLTQVEAQQALHEAAHAFRGTPEGLAR